MAKHAFLLLTVFAGILPGGSGFAQDDEDDNASQLWSGKDATGEEEEAERASIGSPQVRTTKTLGAGFRYGNVFFDPHALGIELFGNVQPPNFQVGLDVQTAEQNLVDSLEEEPMTDISMLKLKRQQFAVFARYFVRPEFYVTGGLALRKTIVTWEAHERLGTGEASGRSQSDAYLIDLRIGQQWSFKKGWYLTFEAAEFTAAFASKTRHSTSRSGDRSHEVDEVISGLDERGELEGRKPTWELFNLCAGKMF